MDYWENKEFLDSGSKTLVYNGKFINQTPTPVPDSHQVHVGHFKKDGHGISVYWYKIKNNTKPRYRPDLYWMVYSKGLRLSIIEYV